MKLVRIFAIATVLALGLSSFVPVYGCSGVGGSGCRPDVPVFTWLDFASQAATVLDALMP